MTWLFGRTRVQLGLCGFLGSLVALASPAAAAVVTPTLSDDYLPNPGIGFQAMQHPATPVMPETVAYRRSNYGWSEQNPSQAVYDWSEIDADIAVQAALGKQHSFRIYTMVGESFGGHRLPQWVLDEGATLIRNHHPRYSNCVYQARWAEFVEQMRLHFDGNPDIAFIDISGYGNFNEWSWDDSQTEWDDDFANPTTLDGMARRRLADMFIGGSGTIQCSVAGGGTQTVSYSYPGFSQTQLLMPYAGITQSTRYVLSRRSDIGFREDCLGNPPHTDGMLEHIGDVFPSIWPNAPVGYELCGAENLDSALEVLQITHGSIVHENGGDNDLEDLYDTLRMAGYRFTLASAAYPDAAFPESSIDVELLWHNVGMAPAYARMGQDFELRFYLLEGDGDVAASWTLASDPNDWMPADPIGDAPPDQSIDATLVLPPGLNLAQYTAAVGIYDLRTGLHVRIANTGTDAAERYPLGLISLSDGSVCGDGLVNTGVGEQCDDANVANEDCCSSTCQLETGSCQDGSACTTADVCQSGVCVGGPPPLCDDGVECTVDSCAPGSGCTATADHAACDDAMACTADLCVPASGCSHAADDSLCDDGDLCTTENCNPGTLLCEYDAEPALVCAEARAAQILLSDAGGREKLLWKWKNGTIDAGLLGNPGQPGGTAYALCVYSGDELAMSANMAGDALCGGSSSCWSVRTGRVQYQRTDATPDGISSAQVRAGKPGKDRVQIKGKYSVLAVPDPALPGAMFDLSAPVVVQTINQEGGCWGASFDASSVATNAADTFKAARK